MWRCHGNNTSALFLLVWQVLCGHMKATLHYLLLARTSFWNGCVCTHTQTKNHASVYHNFIVFDMIWSETTSLVPVSHVSHIINNKKFRQELMITLYFIIGSGAQLQHNHVSLSPGESMVRYWVKRIDGGAFLHLHVKQLISSRTKRQSCPC